MRIAVSACLLGEPCRFDGASKPCQAVHALQDRYELVPICPEQLGGLPTPRVPSEVQVAAGRADRVVNAQGADVTAYFRAGAQEAVRIAKEEGCAAALLKAKSPSCGIDRVYDGTFSRTLVAGSGMAARAFRESGFALYSEDQVDQLISALA